MPKLLWPAGEPRTKTPKISQFGQRSIVDAKNSLLDELRRLGAERVEITSNHPFFASDRRVKTGDPAVAVYFHLKGQQRCLSCDRWNQIEDNLHALALTINAMRGIERWGASRFLERAFTGFTALPAPEQWWDVLGVDEDASINVCEASYRLRIKTAHPDAGGSEYKASKLNWAISEARRRTNAS